MAGISSIESLRTLIKFCEGFESVCVDWDYPQPSVGLAFAHRDQFVRQVHVRLTQGFQFPTAHRRIQGDDRGTLRNQPPWT